MAETVEIRSVLKLDDRSSDVVEKMKGGFEHLNEKVSEVQHEFASFAKQTLAVAAGFEIGRGIESIREFGHEVLEAGKNLEEEQKQLAGAISMGDKSGRSYDQVKQEAKGLHEELEGLAISAGASTESIVDAFTTIQSRSQRSTEEVKSLTEEMVYASRAVPGGMEGMASAFRDLESGIVRPRNQLVQLMVMTGVVDGNARKVAKNLNAMFQAGQADKVTELAERAITKMSEKMKAAPATFSQTIASLKALRESIFETVGAPILAALVPPLQQLKKYFVEHREAIEKFAHVMGEKVGVWVNEAADKIKEGFQYLQDHAEDIANAIKEGVSAVRAVVEFVIAHREALAIAFGAKMAAPVIGGAVGAVREGIGMVQGIAGAGAPALGIAGGSAAAFATTIAAFAAAVGAWALAIDQWNKLFSIWHGKSDAQQDEEARKERFEAMGKSTGKIDTHAFDVMRAKFVEQADAMGMTSRAAGELADSYWAQHRALRQQADQLDEVTQMISSGKDFEASSQWVVIYDKAVQSHNEAIMQYAADVIAGNQTLQNAFLASGAQLEGGFDKLGELVMGKSEEFGKILKGMGGEGGKGKLPDKVNLNFNGNNFQIKQEFRQGDPDRIAIAFKKELVKSALYRQQSRVSTPFGL
jgi:hypothetical protein